MIDENELYIKAIRYFGVEKQFKKTIEECSELITAILHYEDDKATIIDIAKEVADVEIMCSQIWIILEEKLAGKLDLKNKYRKQKLNKLKRILEIAHRNSSRIQTGNRRI